MESRILIVREDITHLEVEAIVNAANCSLLGGGGVDGAIHRAAGPKLLEACRQLKGCETGKAKITSGYLLKARYVIHTVGPVWKGGKANEALLLASCYTESLLLASQKSVRSLAFPAVSCGVYGYPLPEATRIAFTTVKIFLSSNRFPEKVIFSAFNEEVYENFLKLSGFHF